MNTSLFALVVLAAWIPGWAPSWPSWPSWPGWPHRARPTVIWHGARFGMTPAQVLKLFPAARPTVAGASVGGDVEGASMLIRVADHDTVAHFFFGKRGLSTVELDIVDVEAGRTAANLLEAHELGELLAQKYGPAQTCATPEPQALVQSYSCRWTADPVRIELEYREAAPPPTLTVVYRLNVDAAGSGL
jgi:hypothetical protein